MLCTIFTVVAAGDSVRRRLFHKGGLTVWTVTNVDRGGETVNGDVKSRNQTCVTQASVLTTLTAWNHAYTLSSVATAKYQYI